VDRGFVLSDHADWPGLLAAIAATGAPRVIVTHGYVEPLVRWLAEQGLEAGAFRTEYGDDEETRDATSPESEPETGPETGPGPESMSESESMSAPEPAPDAGPPRAPAAPGVAGDDAP
jgi:putative mRNA 3-end processing factor